MNRYIAISAITIFCLLAIGIGVAWAPIFPLAKQLTGAPLTALPPKSDSLPAEPKQATATLIFGGDVMLSRNVGQKMAKYQDWSWPFANIAGLLADADLTVINLESPFTIGGSHLVKTGSFSFNADPQALAGLAQAGIDVVALANNHILNQGKKGVIDTQKLLTANGIAFAGAGLNESEAGRPAIKEINGIKFGFLSYAYPNDYSVAGASTPGLAGMDISKMTTAVANLKTEADLVAVLMHAGIEYVNTPNKQQVAFAHAAIDAGADLVIGHHPHWAQTVEIYNGKPIVYSLGNLIFDQMWSLETQQGALAEIKVADKQISSIKIIPIKIIDYGQAILATGTDKELTLKRMGLNNEVININN
ncbi:MAG: CapA family protein [Patescibacteria group bacterium]|jgi:poly-gamma-glutamate synthesis protein (capsule biosynthesis protein)